jgi:adenine-specific DNA-methyltransferase
MRAKRPTETRDARQRAETYRHDEEALLRPDVGTQAQFRKKKKPKSYKYDSSLSPALDWDGQNPTRELGEWLLAQIEEASKLDPPHRFPGPRSFGAVEVGGLADAVERLRALSQPFLDWAGKAERLSFDVPTLPLFGHERLSTKAILETLKGHERDRQMEMQLFADPQLPLHQQLEAYEHKGGWVNRLILGDSLVVMNSLLEYEGLGGQVQMIYIDPPYGVKFGSNFQPFVRKRDVKNNDDVDMTREPEMVKAYRDTWELGLHSYLTYLRDRLLVARDLLTPSGSVFVQISDDNLHHVRESLDEVFGGENYVGLICFRKTGSQTANLLPSTYDFVICYARDRSRVKFRDLHVRKRAGEEGARQYVWAESPDGTSRRKLTSEELAAGEAADGWRIFRPGPLTSPGAHGSDDRLELQGRVFSAGSNRHWSLGVEGTQALDKAGRVLVVGNTPCSKLYLDDFPVSPLGNVWADTGGSGFAAKPLYVVYTDDLVIQRCLLMTTDPGDLVFDPTCGSGTTAYVAEQWGRRWITIDTSRVPLALTRQRLLTATFPYYELQDDTRGPAGGFVYTRRHNTKGEEVGGIVPHVTLKSTANDEPPQEEVLVDRPEVESKITRVTGPFVVEATIPTPVDIDGDGIEDSGVPDDASYIDRMLEALRRSPSLQLPGNKTISLKKVRPPAQSLTLSAEAGLEPDDAPVAIVFGPENGAISEKLVYEAASEAHMKHYEQLLVIGFAIEANARAMVDKIQQLVGIPATYVQATPDLVMGDLLKTMRSSQIFSVAGLPDVVVRKVDPEEKGSPQRYEVELLGLDTFDPTTFEAKHSSGDDVPAWLLDTAWNRLSFHVSQAFFPRTSAWDNLKKALKTEFEESVWEHLSGTVTAPFVAGDSREIAVKVLDDRGNELLVVKSLDEAE